MKRFWYAEVAIGLLLAATTDLAGAGQTRPVTIVLSARAGPRIGYGVEQLRTALVDHGRKVEVRTGRVSGFVPDTIGVGVGTDGALFRQALTEVREPDQAFALECRPNGAGLIAGGDDSGALYGCLELVERIEALGGQLPASLKVTDAPKLVLRGPCIGLQRPEIGSDGVQYDFRYLPETFPWFYDKALWTQFLDLLARYRFNTLYLWNGHPFTSILRLEKFPQAQEVDTQQLEANIELFKWLCQEADRRGIWVVQNFYNIHISHALARHLKIDVVHRKPTPLVSDYTSYCITEFIRNYPHVGLMMCLGEALQDPYDAGWLTDVILPAVRAGLKPGQPLPPVLVRSHSTQIFEVLAAARAVYPNVYATAKYNNETLASVEIGGGTRPETTRHYAWEAGGQAHRKLAEECLLVTNVHCVANLEPFRWGAPSFVRQALTSCVETGVRGLHLYPLRYWEWPYTADAAEPRLLQPERDWIWFATWARYAWNPDRDEEAERAFWTRRLATRYGSARAARLILDAYELSGKVMPHTTRAFAVSSENYLASTMGQTLGQLFQSKRWYAPPGETIAQYAQREAAGQEHVGETPLDAARTIAEHAEAGFAAAMAAAALVTRQKEEFARLLDDTRAIRLVARFYASKSEAAVAGLLFLRTRQPDQLDRCLTLLAESVRTYRELAKLTARTYLDCAGRHDAGRRYPYPAPKYLVWSDMLPKFQQELALVEHNADRFGRQPEAVENLSEAFFSKRLGGDP